MEDFLDFDFLNFGFFDVGLLGFLDVVCLELFVLLLDGWLAMTRARRVAVNVVACIVTCPAHQGGSQQIC